MRGLRSVAVSLVLLAAVSACAPTPSDAAKTVPRLDPLVVSSLVIDATGITAVRATGVAADRVEFEAGSKSVIGFLTGILGSPLRSYPAVRGCFGTREVIDWPASGIQVEVPLREPGGDAPRFVVSAVPPPETARVAIAAAGGASIGDDASEWLAGFAPEQVFGPFGSNTLLAYDVIPDHPDPFGKPGLFGAIAHVDEFGTLQSLRSPTSFSAYYC